MRLQRAPSVRIGEEMKILSASYQRLCTTALLVSMVTFAGCASGPGGVRAGAMDSNHSQSEPRAPTLYPCPSRPSCVVSLDEDPAHKIAPLAFSGGAEDAMTRLSAILARMPRTTVVLVEAHYLHATQRSRFMGYTDDIEFLLDPDNGRIDVRSCARVGYYDFGVNRQRIETIRAQLNQ